MSAPIKLPLVDGVLYIDNSSMELFTTCPRQAYYYTIRKRELNKSKIALDFGQAFHSVIEYALLKYGTAYRSQTENADIVAFAQKQVLDTPEDDYRTVSYLTQGVQKYISDYPAESFTLVKMPNGAPAVEVPFMYPLGTIISPVYGTITIIWTGKIDVAYHSNGRLGLMDHKTTSMMGPQFFAEFDISHQFYGYSNALEHILNEPVHEVTINGLGCRKPTRTGTTFEYNRHIIPLTQDLKDEWKSDTLAIIRDFIQHAEQGYFPKATKWCVAKYGVCQYKSICSLGINMREIALATSEYRDVTWDPLKKST